MSADPRHERVHRLLSTAGPATPLALRERLATRSARPARGSRPRVALAGAVAAIAAATVLALTAPGAASGATAGPASGVAAAAGGRVAAAAGGLVADATAPSSGSAAPTAVTAVGFDPTNVDVGISLVKNGFVDPVLVTNAGDGSGRLFVVEQAGRIRIIDGGTVLATPFLDLRGSITSGGERGLLGLAFHPNFATHPYVYVNFTDRNGNTAINRYRVSSDPNVLDRASGGRILTIGQPYANHNGGNIAF